ncbi:MAG: hypothetical protein QQN55_04365 [Nitrosopumilus sp.]
MIPDKDRKAYFEEYYARPEVKAHRKKLAIKLIFARILLIFSNLIEFMNLRKSIIL